MIIYEAINKINKMSYIGQTTKSLSYRKEKHYHAMKYYNYYFYNALKKYGWDNFEWKIIEECDTKEDLNKMEIYYIKQHNTLRPYGYNISEGGSGGDNYTNNPNKNIIKQKLVDYWKNNKHPWIGRKHSKKSKRKMSESAKNRICTEETRKKFSKIRSNMIGKKNPLSMKWKIIFPDGKNKIIYSLRNFCNTFEDVKLDFGAMQRTANGKQKTHKGYKCEYINSSKKE